MRTLWYVIYNLFGVPSIWLFFRVYSVFNSKVREGFKSRKDLFDKLDKSFSVLKGSKNVIIHCSSLGEFQQSIPLIEELNKKNYNIAVSFFSPSGYINSKLNFPKTVKTYLPLDSVSNQKKILELTKPDLIIFIRYDLWYNLLYESKRRNIKTVLANARYDEKDITWNLPVVASFKKALYSMIDTIFVIDEYDETNYRKKLKGTETKIIKIGDSKFERVYQSAKEYMKEKILPDNITKAKKLFIVGSSWKEDEDVVLPAINKIIKYEKNLLTLLVPHEPKETKIIAIEENMRSRYPQIKTIRYSQLENYSGENLIIVDRIGILSKLYSAALVSYVGGGFKTGLHNILEPAIFNMPILFSNEVKNSDEDEILLKYGCGILVKGTKDFYKNLRKILKDENFRKETGDKCREVFRDNLNVSEKIIGMVT